MMFDNPKGFCNIIINDVFYWKPEDHNKRFPVLPSKYTEQSEYKVSQVFTDNMSFIDL